MLRAAGFTLRAAGFMPAGPAMWPTRTWGPPGRAGGAYVRWWPGGVKPRRSYELVQKTGAPDAAGPLRRLPGGQGQVYRQARNIRGPAGQSGFLRPIRCNPLDGPARPSCEKPLPPARAARRFLAKTARTERAAGSFPNLHLACQLSCGVRIWVDFRFKSIKYKKLSKTPKGNRAFARGVVAATLSQNAVAAVQSCSNPIALNHPSGGTTSCCARLRVRGALPASVGRGG